jgi:hypothetical protein
LLCDLGDGQCNIPELRTLLEEILPQKMLKTGFSVTHDFPTIGRRALLLNARGSPGVRKGALDPAGDRRYDADVGQISKFVQPPRKSR